jgi:hypothetical protein
MSEIGGHYIGMNRPQDVWEVEGDDATWTALTSEESEVISNAYLNESSVTLKRSGHMYRVDFATMIMVKVETMRTRRIRKKIKSGDMFGGMFADNDVLSGDLLGTMLGGTLMDELASTHLSHEPAPAIVTARRTTATKCRVEGCNSLHRYTDGFCNTHRSLAKRQVDEESEDKKGASALLPELSPKAKQLVSGEWKDTRRRVAMELHETEQSFVRDLEALKEVFLFPLTGKDVMKPRESNLKAKMTGLSNTVHHRRRSVSGGRLGANGGVHESSKSVVEHGEVIYEYLLGVDDTERAVVAFAPLQIEQILALNIKFSSDLGEILEGTNYSERTKLGGLFMRYAKYFNYYSEYCSAHASSADALSKLEQQSRRCRQYMVEAQGDPRCRGKNLASLLICPVQRLPRYELLVRELLKCTPIEHIDRQELVFAYHKLQEAATHLNASLDPAVATNSMTELMVLAATFHPARQRRGIAKPGRQLIYKGELTKLNHTGEKRMLSFFLFSDGLLIYGNKRQLGGYFIERSNKERRELKIKRVRADDMAVRADRATSSALSRFSTVVESKGKVPNHGKLAQLTGQGHTQARTLGRFSTHAEREVSLMVNHDLSDSDSDDEDEDDAEDAEVMQRAEAMDPQVRRCCFHIFSKGKSKSLFLQAKSIDEQQTWVAQIEHVLHEHATRKQARNGNSSSHQ